MPHSQAEVMPGVVRSLEPPPFSPAGLAPGAAPLRANGYLERRRPGRDNDVSPELIALMRNPASRSARVRVALYDAPGFMLPEAPRLPRTSSLGIARVMVAMTVCSVASMVVFKAMLAVWG